MEGMWKIFHGELISLSEQQFVDCVQLCYGCNGGNTSIVFNYYGKNNYSYKENSYPYVSGSTGNATTCRMPSSG